MCDSILVENFDFALTVQIPAFKKVHHNFDYKAYANYTKDEQEQFIIKSLLNAYNKYVSYDMQHHIEFNFETHPSCKKGRRHLHTTIKCLPAYKMRDIQSFFCKCLGIKTLKQSMDIFYYEPKYSDAWEQYQQKDNTLDNMEADLLLLQKPKNKLIVEF